MRPGLTIRVHYTLDGAPHTHRAAGKADALAFLDRMFAEHKDAMRFVGFAVSTAPDDATGLRFIRRRT